MMKRDHNLESYQLGRDPQLLGQGAFATVYLGHDVKNDNKPVAVKVVMKKNIAYSYFAKEIAILESLKSLQHKNLVSLLSYMENTDFIYLITEFCNGGDLDALIKSVGTLEEDVIALFLKQMANGMEVLHKRKIVHRDLKPANIMIHYSGSEVLFKIADFGFARVLKEGNMAATMCGSPLYMAPEIHMRDAYDSKADLWSLGAITYQCLSGHPPFIRSTCDELANFYSRSDRLVINFNDKANVQLKGLITGLLVRDPLLRMAWDDFFNHSFIANGIKLLVNKKGGLKTPKQLRQLRKQQRQQNQQKQKQKGTAYNDDDNDGGGDDDDDDVDDDDDLDDFEIVTEEAITDAYTSPFLTTKIPQQQQQQQQQQKQQQQQHRKNLNVNKTTTTTSNNNNNRNNNNFTNALRYLTTSPQRIFTNLNKLIDYTITTTTTTTPTSNNKNNNKTTTTNNTTTTTNNNNNTTTNNNNSSPKPTKPVVFKFGGDDDDDDDGYGGSFGGKVSTEKSDTGNGKGKVINIRQLLPNTSYISTPAVDIISPPSVKFTLSGSSSSSSSSLNSSPISPHKHFFGNHDSNNKDQQRRQQRQRQHLFNFNSPFDRSLASPTLQQKPQQQQKTQHPQQHQLQQCNSHEFFVGNKNGGYFSTSTSDDSDDPSLFDCYVSEMELFSSPMLNDKLLMSKEQVDFVERLEFLLQLGFCIKKLADDNYNFPLPGDNDSSNNNNGNHGNEGDINQHFKNINLHDKEDNVDQLRIRRSSDVDTKAGANSSEPQQILQQPLQQSYSMSSLSELSQLQQEQLLLYLRALELLVEGIDSVRLAVGARMIKSCAVVKNVLNDLTSCYQNCLQATKMFKQRSSLDLQSLVRNSSNIEKLLYKHALHSIKSATTTELMGFHEECQESYKISYILLHWIECKMTSQADKNIAKKYKERVESKIKTFEKKGFVYIQT